MMRHRMLICICAAAIAASAAGTVRAQDFRRGPDTHFDNRDRGEIYNWYRDHPGNRVFAADPRWNEEMDRRLQPGVVLGRDVRNRAYPLPGELAARLGPLPRRFRYVVTGNHVCVVNNDWQLFDVMHLELGWDRDRDRDRDHDGDRDRGPGFAIAFSAGDRAYMDDWYRGHRGHLTVEFDGRDHWRPEYERRFVSGYVVEPELRRWAHPVPVEFEGHMQRLPRGYRYVVIGDHICVVDDGWRVYDVYHFDR
jgi:hypothetical protein